MKERIKSTSFWAGVIGAVFIILGAFGVEIGDEVASTVINCVCSALIMLGIVSPAKAKDGNGNNDGDSPSAPKEDDE